MRNKPIVCRKLKGLMAEKELTIRKLAEMVGVSENSLTLKINGHRDWWYWEILEVAKIFNLEVEKVFPELVSASIKSA